MSSPGIDREDPDGLLSPRDDPAGAAFGTLGTEAGSDLNWLQLLRERIQVRAASSSRHSWWVLWSLLAGLLALNFTFTVFIVALPSVAHQLHTSVTVLSWTMIGPLLAYGLAAPILGRLGDLWGHHRLYLAGLASALVSAALTALSINAGWLLAARAIDGVQGAATGTASGALIAMVFSPETRVKAMGWWSLVGAGGPVLGVSLGAPIIAAWGWRALFWVQCGLIAFALIVVWVVLPRSVSGGESRRAGGFRSMDWLGSWALSGAVLSVMLGLSLAPSRGWANPVVLALDAGGVLFGAGFVWRLRTAAHPLIPPHYFRQRNFAMPLVARATCTFAYFGGFFLFPLLMERGYDFSIGRVGAVAVARPIVFALSSPVAGYVAMRVGERVSATAGAVSLVVSLSLFALAGAGTGVLFIILALALSGLGMGVVMPTTSSVMANEVRASEFGVMSAAQMIAVQVGEVAGIEVLETLQQNVARQRGLLGASNGPDLLSTFHTPFVVGAVVAGVGVVAAFFMRAVPRAPQRAEPGPVESSS